MFALFQLIIIPFLTIKSKSGQCKINLDGMKGEHPPLITQDDMFVLPDGERNLKFGRISPTC